MIQHTQLHSVIFNMEDDVRDLIAWAETVFELGTSANDPSDCLLVVGPAMRACAERVVVQWDRALDLSTEIREATQ